MKMRERERGGVGGSLESMEYLKTVGIIAKLVGGTGGKTESKGFGIQNDWVLL